MAAVKGFPQKIFLPICKFYQSLHVICTCTVERGRTTTVNHSFLSLKDVIDFLVQLAFDAVCCSIKVTAAKSQKDSP